MAEKSNRTIFLCGFMGCGKSTAGRLLADRLGCEFNDMDEYIVKKQGRSITQIFAEKGEDYFRETETDAVRTLADAGGVVACGGGAMLKKKNADIASEHGIVVYIELSFDECYDRISGETGRPIVSNNTREELNIIYDGRVPVYKEHSAVTVSGSGTPNEVADRIMRAVESCVNASE